MRIYKKSENTYRALAKALEPLELEGRLRYLPSFECCGSCAGARIHTEDWGDAEFFVHFNEQSKESADDSCELLLFVQGFNQESLGSPEHEEFVSSVRTALIAGGFEEIATPDGEYYGRPLHDPSFKPNSFYVQQHGLFMVRGYFEGKAQQAKKVREHLKELGLNGVSS